MVHRSQDQILLVHLLSGSVRAAVSHLTQWEHWAVGPKSEPEVRSLHQSTSHAKKRPILMDPLEAGGLAYEIEIWIIPLSALIWRCTLIPTD